MKIIFATKGLEQAVGGSERVFTEICNELYKYNNDISVLTFDRDNYVPFYSLNSSVKKITLNHGGIYRHASIFSFLKSIYLLRKVIIKEKPDVIIAFMHSMYVPVAFASLFLKVKVIASEHATYNYYKKKKLEMFLIRLSAPFISKIVFLSKEISLDYPKCLQKKTVIISNPVRMNFQNVSFSPYEKEDVILSVGKFNSNKRHKVLIDAFVSISDKYPDWRLIILGDGYMRKDFIKFIDDKSMKDRIELPGIVKNIESYYSKSKIIVLASIEESFGLSVAEAMCFECAPICFSSSYGAKELIVNSRNGLLVNEHENEKIKKLSEALEELINNPERCLEYGRRSKQLIINKYTISNIINRWLDLLNSKI